MRWPWVSRSKYNALEHLYTSKTMLYEELLERSVKQAEFWQEKYEKEQARADRAVDSLVVAAGHQPISEESRSDSVKVSEAIIDMQRQTAEIFGDVENSIVGVEIDPSTQAAVENDPDETPEENKSRRLAVIKARIEAKNAEKGETAS